MSNGHKKYPKANPGALTSLKKEMETATERTERTRGRSTSVHGKQKARRQFPSQAQMAAASAKNKKRFPGGAKAKRKYLMKMVKAKKK